MSETHSNPMASADLLIELGCEELPPKSLDAIRDAFFQGVCSGLEKSALSFDAKRSRGYSSPRRLALFLADVPSAQADQELERRGPSLKAAFDENGDPTPAALGFARSVGREPEQLETLENDKGSWLYARVHVPGKPLSELIYPILEQALRQLPVPKPMRWADNDFSFVRPVHWLIVLHGETVIDGRLLGLEAGRETRGHRIHSPGPHVVKNPADYLEVLERSYVLADQDLRRERIRRSLLDTDTDVIIDPSLLNEVCNLVEWPVPVACTFETEFLKVPHEALIASMQDHQKFFPVGDAKNSGRVCNRFIAISNIESTNEASVREGYERVIRPRLADARFFLEQDLKQPLEAFSGVLDRVVFQTKIGSVGDKSRRMSSVSAEMAEFLGIDPSPAKRAAMLSKCDLMTQMVGEFPELQGTMGGHYAAASGEPEAVSVAIGEHYRPRFAGDAVPLSPAGQIVSIADRADTLVGIFAAGLRPTGNKDPFALRRASLGLIRILLECGIEIPLQRVLSLAAAQLGDQVAIEPGLVDEVGEFVAERLRHYCREKGYQAELITAVLNSSWDTLPDFDRRLAALAAFMGQASAASLAGANKRIANILRKAEAGALPEIDDSLLKIEAEAALFAEIQARERSVIPLMDSGDYTKGLEILSELRPFVDAFFDAVMVMDDNMALRNNRLALLNRMKMMFDRVGDLAVLG